MGRTGKRSSKEKLPGGEKSTVNKNPKKNKKIARKKEDQQRD